MSAAMGQPTILKNVHREGQLVASVIQDGSLAKVMLKGAEPNMPRDPAFTESLRVVTKACWPHLEKFEHRELCAVLVQRPAQAELVDIDPGEVRSMGLQRVTIMDGDSGIVVRVCDDTPGATALAYASLRATSASVAQQPGRVDVPAAFIRRTYKDLSAPQRQTFEIAVQIAGPGLLKAACVEDEGLKMVVVVKDLPPARARSILFPLGAYADDLGRGSPPDEIAKRLAVVRAG